MSSVSQMLARLEETLGRAFRDNRPIEFRSTLLREGGEEKLERIVDRLLLHLGQPDLIGPAYAAIRELVQNASKANLKRVLFDELGVDPNDRRNYHEGMDVFRKRLTGSRMADHASLIHDQGLYFRISFHYNKRVLCVAVRNPFILFPAEEKRVREKFVQSEGVDNLYDFYRSFSDSAEGAGMGIAMVQILLVQAGFSHRCLSIFSDTHKNQTVARIILPLSPTYRLPRERFAAEAARRGVPAEQLREEMRQRLIDFPILSSTVETSDWYSDGDAQVQ
ncbi:MAG: hypothetical protein RIF32_23785 [Leptospirales bacterium]|jgi:hypothetical protein